MWRRSREEAREREEEFLCGPNIWGGTVNSFMEENNLEYYLSTGAILRGQRWLPDC